MVLPEVGIPASRMGNYIVNGQNAITYLAMRYGDPSGPLGAAQYTGGQANIADKLAPWAAVSPAAVLQWDCGVNQAQNPWCARPGPGAAGADADGWQEWANATMSAG